MPSNIEIKAVLKDRVAAEATAARICDTGPETIHQEDFFFVSNGARLKLRVFAPDRGELIRYERADATEARRSRYLIARTPDPGALLGILTATLGRTGAVKKTRVLYLVGQTRIHIDQVVGLGDFLELEVVLRPEQTDMEGKTIAAALLAEFGIDSGQVIGEAYVDLLARQSGRRLRSMIRASRIHGAPNPGCFDL
jgi:predicted adenylyl cyclase CyaB